jgi:hypothetical protein
MNSKNIAFGVITNYVNSLSPYLEFIENAKKYNHKITAFIIAYSHDYNKKIVNKLAQHVDIQLIKMNNDPEFKKRLNQIGLSKKSIKTLVESKNFSDHNLIPYGKRRNNVLVNALLLKPRIDYLIFVDTDVKPYLLTDEKGDFREIDFIQRHLDYLKNQNVIITTSDYSGYYIIPPIKCDGLREFLIGLGKEDVYSILTKNKTLVTASPSDRNIQKTDKVLGGNHALKLSAFNHLPPYFSVTYIYKGQLVLGRGEDTLIGMEIPSKGMNIIDIDTKIFHNTFSNFPTKPSIYNPEIKNRFYIACLGWLGRNSFMNWYQQQTGKINYQEFKARKERQKDNLTIGSTKLASFLGDRRFADLPLALDAAYNQLGRMIEEYKKINYAWKELKEKVTERGIEDESFTC